MESNTKKEFERPAGTPVDTLTCGLVMPISPMDGCSAEHWSDVKQILQDAIESVASPKFTARLVSDADDVGVIQKRIVQGVYNSDIIVCDVSGKNANVMFELGMRLAFDRPTVIVKDDKTDYSFDTGVIEHLTYPRDLRFSRIVAFKKQLADKIAGTFSAAKNDPEHSTFLKSFGTFKVAHLEQKEASGDQLMMDMMQDMQKEMSMLRRNVLSRNPRRDGMPDPAIVGALLALKKIEPNLSLEESNELVEVLLDKYSHTTKPYNSRQTFEAAVKAACDLAKDLA